MNIWKKRITHNEIRYDVMSHQFVGKEYNIYSLSYDPKNETLMAILYVLLLFSVFSIIIRITLEASISINSWLTVIFELIQIVVTFGAIITYFLNVILKREASNAILVEKVEYFELENIIMTENGNLFCISFSMLGVPIRCL
jgi:hypothetical protein